MERWKRNLYVLWVSQIISLTSFGFGLPFLPFYIQTLGVVDPEQVKLFTGILSTAPAVTMAIMSPIWGALSDRFGQKLMIQRAMAAAAIIIALMGTVDSVWMLVALRVTQGIFTGTVTAASTFVAVNTPNMHLSYALGFLSSSTFIGYSLGPLLGAQIAEQFGYRTSFYVGGGLMLVGFLLVTFLVKGERRATGVGGEKKERSLSRAHFGAIFSRSLLVILAMLFLHRVIRSIFNPFIPLYITEYFGIAEGAVNATGNLNGAVGFMTALAAISISRLGDRHSKPRLLRVMLLSGAVAVTVSALMQQYWAFFVAYVTLFFLLGGIEPLLTAEAARSTDPGHRGALLGVLGLVGSLGWMVSPMLGTFLSIQFGLNAILWLMLALILLNFLISWGIKAAAKPPSDEEDVSLPTHSGDGESSP